MEQTLLQVDGLTKQYGNFTLDHVSFSVPGGSIMGFVGENGAGKTTTLKLILDELPRDSGTVRVFGQDNRCLLYTSRQAARRKGLCLSWK